MKSLYLFFCLFFLVVFCACTKQVPGPKGEPGTPAKQGNMKLVSSGTFTVSSSAWRLENDRYKTEVSVSTLSELANTSGEVEAYMLVDGAWWKLPYGVGDLFMQASFETELLRLDYAKIHDGPPEKPGIITFRLVVFEPSR